jgi:transposase-like protein
MAHLHSVRDAPNRATGVVMAHAVIDRFSRTYSAAIACFSDDLDALLNDLKLPARHRITCRKTTIPRLG